MYAVISYRAFGALRLHQFIAPEDVAVLENWEFRERLWFGEAVRFSEWLRDYKTPDLLGSLALDDSLPPSLSKATVPNVAFEPDAR